MSPRPKKPRRCDCPQQTAGLIMKPVGIPTKALAQVVLGIDEFEALRLCDREGRSQAAAGAQMGVSRGTVQRLVASGRKKMISALVDGKALVVKELEQA